MAQKFFNINEHDILSSQAPLHFDLSVFDIFVTIKSGGTVVVVPEQLSYFPVKLAEYIDTQQISVWNSVSSIIAQLVEKGNINRFQFENLKKCNIFR